MGVIEKFQVPVEKANNFFAWFNWLLLLVFRVHVAWVFFKSGWWKLTNWEQNLAVFEFEYQVPLLHYETAAYLATFGELVFPVFLLLGFGTRFAAIAISVINIVAVVSYYGALAKGAGLVWHYLWGAMLLVNLVYGGGLASIDHYLRSRSTAFHRPVTA